MKHIQIANLACGGHAGDSETVEAFRALASENGVAVSAHLSYPDRQNFGRVSMPISTPELMESLADQFRLLPDVRLVKLHGALYNDACRDADLARRLASWLREREIHTVITAGGSEMAAACTEKGIQVLAEAFAERRYRFFPETGSLALVSRKLDYASIRDCGEAVKQSEEIVKRGRVKAVVASGGGGTGAQTGGMTYRWVPIKAETICIHSDSPISLELAKRLEGMKGFWK
jgi:UPF0271 protein